LLALQTDPCTRRTVVVSASDASRAPATFQSADLAAEVAGHPAILFSVRPLPSPGRVVIAIDGSASVSSDTTLWLLVRILAEDMVSRLPGRQVAILYFGEKVERQTDFSSNRAGLFAFIRSLQPIPGGRKASTGIFDSLQGAKDRLTPAQPGDVIYLLSDGQENVSLSSRRALGQALASQGIRLFGLLLHDQAFLGPNPDQSPAVRDAIINSGGAVLDLDPTAGHNVFRDKASGELNPKLKEAIESRSTYLASQIASAALVEIGLPDSISAHKSLRLTLKFTDGTRSHRSWQLYYPHELPPCPDESGRK
jgi:hypothetical protein